MGGGKFLLENLSWEGEGYNGEMVVFKVSLHNWERGANPPILWRLPYIAYHPLFFLEILSNHWINDWSRHIWCAILLNDNMNLHMLSLCIIAPEGPWCVFYTTGCQVYWGLTHVVVFYCYPDLISHTRRHNTLWGH